MKNRRSRLIVSTMRDEGPFILEWLAYHRVIGFTDFLIYTNDCRDGTDLLLDRLQYNGIVTHVRNKVLRRGPHKSALKYAMAHELYAQAEWVYVCDADEFLNIKAGEGKFDDLLARYPEADALPVAWRLFSNSGLENLGGALVTERLEECEPAEPSPGDVGRFVKTAFRPAEDVVRLGLHAPVYADEDARRGKWGAAWLESDEKADPRRPVGDFGYDIAQVNHYAVRGVDEYLLKRDRGRANHVGEKLGLDYWKRWSRSGSRDISIQGRLPAVRDEIQNLRIDPIVAALSDGASAFHKQRLAELLQDEAYQKLRQDILALGTHAPVAPDIPAVAKTDQNEKPEIKAPKRHQNRLRMLGKMPKGGRCAEVGVWNGGFSSSILEVTQPRELVLIDPWDLLADQDEAEWTHKKHKEHEAMRTLYEKVAAQYGTLENVTIRKGFSAEVLGEYPDNYFDWVYIDGNHLYDFVRNDIKISFKKVRPGGIIAGDDFFWKRDNRMHVREAVLDAMRSEGMTNRPTRFGQQYMIYVPE